MAPFADRLKNLRDAAGLSQEALARLAGITKDHVGKLERGEQENPTAGTIEALATALGVHPTALLWNEPTHEVVMPTPGDHRAKITDSLDARGREFFRLWPDLPDHHKKAFLDMARGLVHRKEGPPKKTRKAVG